MGAEVVVASEEQQALAGEMGKRFARVDLCEPAAEAARLVGEGLHVDAAIGVDEQGVLLAAHVAARLGIPHNPVRAVVTSRDKALTRIVLSDAGLDQPAHRVVTVDGDVKFAAAAVGYPCVVKAIGLAGSRGVIRANNPDQLASAAMRVTSIIAPDGDEEIEPFLVEGYVPGLEVAVEGLLRSGSLEVLAIFDKPDPLEGPYFEESIYVTPSRLPASKQDAVVETVARACRAMGLVEGPIHAEVRLPDDRPLVLEIAARSIGGLCSRVLKFGAGISLEEVIVRHGLGLELGDLQRSGSASGVMMIPIPKTGALKSVEGIDDARAVAGVDGIEIMIPVGHDVVALPEGDRYLGFVFASGETPERVEASLRQAHFALGITIE
ncbi:MAG: ATP-grasp domain-containing protein [Actinomycetota bacterium]